LISLPDYEFHQTREQENIELEETKSKDPDKKNIEMKETKRENQMHEEEGALLPLLGTFTNQKVFPQLSKIRCPFGFTWVWVYCFC